MVGEQFVGRAEISVNCLQLIAFDSYYWTRGGITLGSLFPISRTFTLGLVAWLLGCAALGLRYCQRSENLGGKCRHSCASMPHKLHRSTSGERARACPWECGCISGIDANRQGACPLQGQCSLSRSHGRTQVQTYELILFFCFFLISFFTVLQCASCGFTCFHVKCHYLIYFISRTCVIHQVSIPIIRVL